MTDTYRRYTYKLAIKRGKVDARKALNRWHQCHIVGIDIVIENMGYTKQRSGYDYTKQVDGYMVHLDTYELIIRGGNAINVYVKEV